MLRVFLLLAVCCTFLGASAQKNEFVIQYINTYKQLAIEEMIRTGVPASITLAQGIHETEAGRSDLVTRSNNHFGIKCKTGWSGDKVYHDDDERGECFRSYTSATDSYMDHSNFLKNGQRYAFLFDLDPTDYKAWAFGLKKAGYATNVKYSNILIKFIEDYNLQQYSLIALGKLSAGDEIFAGQNKPSTDTKITTVSSGPAVVEEVAPVVDYPSGEFLINRTRVVYAPAGTSLLALAKQYDISIGRLLDFNDLSEEDVLVEAQLIFLQRKRKTGAEEFHTVQPGETVYSISQVQGIRLESLLKYNNLTKGSRPAAGEKLSLQRESEYTPRLVSSTTSSKPVVREVPVEVQKPVMQVTRTKHVVQPKETLYGIARYYNTTTEKIMEWNKLDSTQLKKGQELVIYKN